VPNPEGRPTDYRVSHPEQAYKLCLLGATDADLAAFFEVTEQTINNWKIGYPEFFESIKDGKEKADAHIAQKLYNRAEGAEWIEDQAIKVKRTEYDASGKKTAEFEEVITVPVRRAAPPDTTAGMFWLKNRKSSKWRDKMDHEVAGKDGGPIEGVLRVEHV
jgi:hypothetical protein